MKYRLPIDPPGALRLHFNENTAGCSPAVLKALRALSAEDLATYPTYESVIARLGAHWGVADTQLMLTNGLDEGLLIVAQHAAWHRNRPSAGVLPEFVIPEPAFEVFAECTELVGARAVHVNPGPDLAFPLAEVLEAITPATRVVYLVDPNNPTGVPIPADAVGAIAEAAPDAVIFVDEAYADFAGRTLIGPALNRYPNLVVGRTFAKAHGLAGLRVGALVAAAATIDRLRLAQPYFNVNIAAVRALEAALDDTGFLAQSIAAAAESRELVFAFCRRRDIRFWPSTANFVLMRVGSDAGAIARHLAAQGILVRDKSVTPGCQGCLRVTTGVVAHTKQFLAALEEILATRAN